MTPFDLFLFLIAGGFGLACALVVLGATLGAAWVIGSVLVRRLVG